MTTVVYFILGVIVGQVIDILAGQVIRAGVKKSLALFLFQLGCLIELVGTPSFQRVELRQKQMEEYERLKKSFIAA